MRPTAFRRVAHDADRFVLTDAHIPYSYNRMGYRANENVASEPRSKIKCTLPLALAERIKELEGHQ